MSIRVRAVKGRLNNNDFYSGVMSFASVDRNVLLPDNKHWNGLFGETDDGDGAQRNLNLSRVKNEIVPYLDNKDAFFSSLALIMVPMGGKKGLVEGEHYAWVPDPTVEDGVETGTLVIQDEVQLFPGDGMHRTAAITEALKENPDLAREKISVVLVPYRDRAQVQQLFADLNRNAKPVSASIALNYEIRDPVVIISKRMIGLVPLFSDRVNMVGNSLSAKSPDVIAFNTLVSANSALLAAMLSMGITSKPIAVAKHDSLAPLHGAQPLDQRVDDFAAHLKETWEIVISAIPEWAPVIKGNERPGNLRGKGNSGYVFAFGVGWQGIALAAAALMAHRDTWKTDLAKAVGAVDWKKGPHWHGIAMIGDRVNNTGPGIRATAGYILHQGGFKDEPGVQIKDLLTDALNKSLSGMPDSNTEAKKAA